MMNEREKSLKLAELMGWHVYTYHHDNKVLLVNEQYYSSHPKLKYSVPTKLEPFAKTKNGLAQFASILLKNTNIITRFVNTSGHTPDYTTTEERYKRYGGVYQGYIDKPFTQEAILDEILIRAGVEI